MISPGWVIVVNCTGEGAPVVEAHSVDAPGLLAVIAQLQHPQPPSAPPPAPQPRRVRVLVDRLNVRADHNPLTGTVLWTARGGDEYPLMDTWEGVFDGYYYIWAQIDHNGRKGWLCLSIGGSKKAEVI